jgi:uncharacterized membrane protein
MKQTLADLFGTYAHSIVFIHVLSAFIWVGGMIAIRLAVHPNLMLIEDTKIRLGRTLAITGRFFNIVMPFILLLILTAVLMAVGLNFRDSAVDASGNVINEANMYLYNLVHVKEAIWMIMAGNFTWMYLKRRKAQKFFDNNRLADAKLTLALIPKVLLPLNIVLGIVAIWLGVTLRGF